MFGYDNVHSVSVCVSDPGADATIPIARIPARMTKAEVIAAYAVCDTDVKDGIGTAFTLRLLDYGNAGTAVAGTVSATLGAAGTGDWSKNTPRAFTISEGTLDGGDWIAVVYDETGTVAPKNIIVTVEFVNGVGA